MSLSAPADVAVDETGNVYVADTDHHVIRKITPAGLVTTLAGAVSKPGSSDGIRNGARFYYPKGIAVGQSGDVYVADTANHTIRRITADGVVPSVAGSARNAGSVDGAGSVARFYYPSGVATDRMGNVYVADSFNSTIRLITRAGAVRTLAGLVGSVGNADGRGDAARFNHPSAVAPYFRNV